MSSPSISLGDLFSLVLLVLEMSDFSISLIDFVEDSVKRHDSLHEWSWDPSGEEANEDIVVHDVGVGNVALEGQDVTLSEGENCPFFLVI